MHVVLEARSPWTLFGLTLVFTQALHDIVIVVMGTLPPDPCSSLPFTLVFTQCHVHASHMHVVLGALPPDPVRVLFLIIICSIRLIRTQCHVPTVRINRLPLSIQHPLQGHPPQDPLQLPLSIQHPALGRSPPRLPLRLSLSIQRTRPSPHYAIRTADLRAQEIRYFDGKCARRGMASCHITVVSPSDTV